MNDMREVIVEIDPGKSGALVVLDRREGLFLEALRMPDDARWLHTWFDATKEHYGKVRVVMEKAHGGNVGGRTMGGKSMFTYGRHFGHLEAVVFFCGISLTLVSPRTWTTEMHKGAHGVTPKEKSLSIAQSLWPLLPFTFTEKAKKPHEGIVDALLIAEYARRRLP